jgi:hypothetical protein
MRNKYIRFIFWLADTFHRWQILLNLHGLDVKRGKK